MRLRQGGYHVTTLCSNAVTLSSPNQLSQTGEEGTKVGQCFSEASADQLSRFAAALRTALSSVSFLLPPTGTLAEQSGPEVDVSGGKHSGGGRVLLGLGK
jgi:hypothetical protein